MPKFQDTKYLNIDMKKLYSILIGLLLLTTLQGQILKFSNYVAPVPPETPTNNMVSNGTFDSSTDWTAEANWSIGDGKATWAAVASAFLIQANGDMITPLEVNTTYDISFYITISSGNAVLRFDNAAKNATFYTPNTTGACPNGTHTGSFTTPANLIGGGISVRASISSNTTWSIDNIVISVHE
jgi:hypothetical protein